MLPKNLCTLVVAMLENQTTPKKFIHASCCVTKSIREERGRVFDENHCAPTLLYLPFKPH